MNSDGDGRPGSRAATDDPTADAGGAGTPTPWLTTHEQDAWRAAVSLALLLPGPLDTQLQRDSGLSLFEYLVLSSLSMEPRGTTAMSSLARLTNGSLTRLSNVVRRLEGRGLVTRHPHPDDGRITLAALTGAGRRCVEQAAPGHVRAVRRVLIDRLDAGQVRTLAEIGALLTEPATGGAGADPLCLPDGPGPTG